MTHVLLSKGIISQGIGIACLNVMLFNCFWVVSWPSVFNNTRYFYLIWEES